MSVSQLYDAETGVLVGPMMLGEGHRQKAWLDEVPQLLQEFATKLKRGRTTNFPSFLNGEGMGSKPIGESYSTPDFDGAQLLDAVAQSAILGVGDASAADFGSEALTQPDPTHADYLNTTTDPDDPPAPRGAQFPAFIQTIVDGGGWNLAATNGILTVEINGVAFSVTGLTGGAVTAENVRDAIIAAGWPCQCLVYNGTTVRIWANGVGVGSNLKVLAAGTVAAVLFTGAGQSAQSAVLYRGGGGPLNQMDNTSSVSGAKPQRRILPGSVSVTMVAAGETISVVDSTIAVGATTGTLAGSNAAGTVTVAGTINYVTGAIDLTMTGDAPDNATNVTAFWKSLVPIKLEEPVRLPPSGRNLALLLL